MSEFGTTPTALVQRMKCAIGGEADIPATQRFFVQGHHAQGDRHLYASGTRFIPEKLLGLFERTTWPVVSASPHGQPWAKAGYPCPACGDVAIEPTAA